MNAAVRLEEIRDELVAQVRTLARDVCPDGRANGAYWIGRNPTRNDRHGGSFWIRIQNPAIGAWADEATGDKGDIIDLVGYWRGCFKDRSRTRAECLRWLGWAATGAPQISEAERRARNEQRARAQEREEREEEQRRADNFRRAFGLWLNAEKLEEKSFAGTILDRYFRSRGLDLVAGVVERGRKLPGAIRFHASHDYRTADGELLALPCMIALITGPDGRPRGVHRTWLRPDGGGKAELPEPRLNKARKIWPSGWQGGVIRIAKGEGDLTPEEAARQGRSGPLVITEGIEDALAIMLAMPGRRVWAAGTLGNIGNVPLLPCVSSVTVAADNDWNKPEAEAALKRSLAALKSHGKPVHEARAPARFKDMNDLLKGETI